MLRCVLYCRKSTEDENRQVASIDSQRRELDQAFGSRADLQIVGIYEEAKSAKTPGRPIFGEMLARIERGEADCILAWAPDRLARNSIDGGRIIYLLDRGILRDLKFATYTFEHNSQGKFMLSIMFGQSKYYSDALSENVKRGNRAKAARGWKPASVPLGYKHGEGKTIAVDGAYFPLIRRMFDLMLTGGYSSRRIARIARDEWGLRGPSHWKRGGGPIAPSTVHRILTNPFYAGIFTVQGEVYAGRHDPMLSPEEFDAVQKMIVRPTSTRAQRYDFPLTGLMHCGACGRAITAERKVKPSGRTYTYYHCSKSGLGPRCAEPSVRAERLEAQVVAWLRSIAIRPEIERRLRSAIDTYAKGDPASVNATRQSLNSTLKDTQAQITELLGLRLRMLITDEEFTSRRAELQAEAIRLARRLEELARPTDEKLIEPVAAGISFSTYAADCFERGDIELKRQIVRIACSNPTLTNKMLSVEAAKWLASLLEISRCLVVRGRRDDVRTLPLKIEKKLRAAMDELDNDNSWQRGLRVIEELRERRVAPHLADLQSPRAPLMVAVRA